MKKKIIFMAVGVVLLLIFASSSYGGPDPRYRLKADPWEEMTLCPTPDSTQIVAYGVRGDNKTFGVLVLRVFGVDIVLRRNVNCISTAKNPAHNPSNLK